MLKQKSKRLLGLGFRETQFPSPRLMVSRLYHERVVDHYNNPRNVGSFDKNDPTVGTGLVGAPACGEVMKRPERQDRRRLLSRPSAVDPPLLPHPSLAMVKNQRLAEKLIKGHIRLRL